VSQPLDTTIIVVTIPNSCWNKKPHHLKVETHLFLRIFNQFLEIYKGGAPISMFREHRSSPFLVKGVPW
jgi:hypothetical protein